VDRVGARGGNGPWARRRDVVARSHPGGALIDCVRQRFSCPHVGRPQATRILVCRDGATWWIPIENGLIENGLKPSDYPCTSVGSGPQSGNRVSREARRVPESTLRVARRRAVFGGRGDECWATTSRSGHLWIWSEGMGVAARRRFSSQPGT
jgi:hypothetical protein